jgi:gamma-glutamylcyclotransferase (GGCT)/AIG2-like uncharacterized protein YtfP
VLNVSSDPIAWSGDSFTLFVYGTLMRNGSRHRTLAGQRFLGEAHTRPLYSLYDLGSYPGLVSCRPEDGQAIAGELYQVATTLLPRLDRIEGAPELYRLEPILIAEHSGPVFAYFYQGDIRNRRLCVPPRWENR